ncbi:hypothetical protein D3C72_1292090 [compost metagenome]
MAAVQDVEAAVGEADLQALTLPRLDLIRQFVQRRDLGLGQGRVLAHLGLDQFGGRDDRRAALAHHHARGQDGELHRRLQRRACAQRQTKRRQRRVAGAGDIIDLARPTREMHHAAVPTGQGHALAGAGDDDRLGRGRRQQGRQRRLDLCVRLNRQAGGPRQFAGVGLDQIDRAITGEVAPLGVHNDRRAVFPTGPQRRRDQGVVHHALGVVGQQDGLGVLEHRLLAIAASCGLLVVQPQQLLTGGDKARLDDGGRALGANQGVLDPVLGGDQIGQFGARRILTDDRAQSGLPAQSRDVARHIAHAAGHGHGAARAQDGDRRLGRDAADLAIDIAVQHQVAHAGDLQLMHLRQQTLQRAQIQ